MLGGQVVEGAALIFAAPASPVLEALVQLVELGLRRNGVVTHGRQIMTPAAPVRPTDAALQPRHRVFDHLSASASGAVSAPITIATRLATNRSSSSAGSS